MHKIGCRDGNDDEGDVYVHRKKTADEQNEKYGQFNQSISIK